MTRYLLATAMLAISIAARGEEPLNEKWLDEDRRLLAALKPVLSHAPDNVAPIRTQYGLEVERSMKDRELGLGNSLSFHVKGGGYASATVLVIADRSGRILRGEIVVSASKQAWRRLGRELDMASMKNVSGLDA